jgi:anti-anti-sigma regulatory factor
MLRITIHETDDAMAITLEGRIAGPWVAELGRAWAEAAPRLSSRKLFLDLRNVTYVDMNGEQALKNIYAQTGATFVATSPSLLFLAGEIAGNNSGRIEMGPANDYSE